MSFLQNLEDWKNKLDEALHQENALTGHLETLEKKSGVRRLHIVLGLLAGLVVFFLVGIGSQLQSHVIGFLYPAYASIKAIESTSKDDDTKWLTYWVVYSAFAFLECFADLLLFWFPFYWLSKGIFLVWCMAPVTNNGSTIIYNQVILPLFLKHQQEVDKALDKASEVFVQVSDTIKENIQTDENMKTTASIASDVVRRHIENNESAE